MSPVLLGSPVATTGSSDKKKKKKRKRQGKSGSSSVENGQPHTEINDADIDGDHMEDHYSVRRNHQNKKIKFDDGGVIAELSNTMEENEKELNQPERIRETRGITPTLQFNKPGHSIGKLRNVDYTSDIEEEDDDDDEGELRLFQEKKSKYTLQQRSEELLKIRETLPVFKVKDELTEQLLQNKVTILIGETGSGKSTQIPQFLLPHSSKKGIAVTQPRRVAAINLATRVAEEYGCNVGQQVGYSVRFQNFSTSNTKLKYLTDGMLLRELMLDNNLSHYNTIIIDEAHERTILTDLLLGFLKQLIAKRHDDFKIIVMSATLDADKFSKFFNDAPILYVEGKMYPVERLYLPKPTEDIVDTMVKTIIQLNQSEPQGDMLCFLPGQEEIDKAVVILNKLAPDLPKTAPYLVALPLYAALPTVQQTKIFLPVRQRQRKVILSTNIAETSVTVPGIKYVIDSGLRKVKAWKHELGLSTLLTAPISQASATQRSGRAGRESAGKSFRLYTEKDYLQLPPQTDPEIIRSDIISPVLMLKKMEVENLFDWPWLEHPGEKSLSSALFQLLSLGALDPKNGEITSLGEKMAVLPLLPHLSAVLITAENFGVLKPVIDIVSCLSVDNLILTPSNDRRDEVNEKRRNFSLLGSRYGDLIMLKEFFDHFNDIKDRKEQQKWCKELDISYKAFKNVKRVRKQLQDYMKNLYPNSDALKFGDDDDAMDFAKSPLDISSILKSFLKGYINNTAIGMPDRSYRTVTAGNLISIHPSSMLFGTKLDGVMYIEYVFTTKGYGRNCSMIELSWLQEIAPHLLGTRISAK